MAQVSALYRYPVKGFTPERPERLVVQADGRIAGDRVLAFRFADAAVPERRDGLDYWPKARGLALQDFPALAALRLEYDETALRVRVSEAAEAGSSGGTLVEAGLDPEGRERIVRAVTDFVLGTREGSRLRRPGRLPLVLVGDGVRSRFQDRPRGFVSVHGSASVDALGAALGFPVDDRRFRSNVVIDGVEAWAELGWTGRVRIGDLVFLAEGPIVRCLATHANPDTGVRDARVLTTLTQRIGQSEPTLGRLLLPEGSAAHRLPGSGGEPLGTIRIGDEVEPL
ncbi:MOSC domain-containing protein [Leucobacter sp. wl10]|uniref:MOSC domain-containing protein n=1 Tax=Leucobacter sp. wl10 TaxID=2304677 RepID=UPI000E5C2556|nr:MOSC N-terminal beta barrel domain-containing protein [Leucobacter sp. wl10]RGE22391.1 MOSC domain-containing protein [Leucobacter sp. wl10]